jgi:hypothetical protein
MTSINSLPTEIILKIVKLIHDLGGSIPINDYNAIWTAPKYPDVPASFPSQQALLNGVHKDEDDGDENEYPEKWTVSVSGAHFPIKSLRL